MQGKWIYDMDPFEPLKYEQPLQQLKARIAEKGSKAVFCPLIEKYILKNTHRVTVEMQVYRGLPNLFSKKGFPTEK
jgi:Zn-dependent M16 (insulinase) family peptidase